MAAIVVTGDASSMPAANRAKAPISECARSYAMAPVLGPRRWPANERLGAKNHKANIAQLLPNFSQANALTARIQSPSSRSGTRMPSETAMVMSHVLVM